MFYYALALGANLGDKKLQLKQAALMLQALPHSFFQASSVYSSEPYHFASKQTFLNAVVAFKTSLDPFQLWQETRKIETALGKRNQPLADQWREQAFPDDVKTRFDQSVPALHRLLCPETPAHPPIWDFSQQKTVLSAAEAEQKETLLAAYQDFHQALAGFIMGGKKWRDRLIDIDIIYAGPLLVLHPSLVIPHYDLPGP